MAPAAELTPLPLKITGLGRYLPPRIQTAEELAPQVGRSARWIRQRTGVAERRISEISVSEMGARAAREALGDAPPPDLVINAGLSPEQLIPDTAPFLLRELGLDGIACWSVHATCLGFLVALTNAASLLQSGAYKRVLVVCAEKGSVCRNMEEPESAVLIGDGAAAAVLERPPADDDAALLAWRLATYPQGIELAEIRGYGSRKRPDDPDTRPQDNLFHMAGPRLYRLARRKVDSLLEDLLGGAGLSLDDVDLVIPHQASGPALAALPRMGIDPDKVVNLVAEHGNCIAASLPLTLATAAARGRLQAGQTVLLLGTGAGLSVGGALLRC